MLIKTKKINWLKCLKAYHSLYKTYFKNNYSIKLFKLDKKFKLKDYKANK